MHEQDEVYAADQAVDPDVPRPVQTDRATVATDPIPSPTAVADPDPPPYVYALGQIDARFPSLGVEKEFDQVAALMPKTAGMTERRLLKEVINDPYNLYLARSLCWVLLVQGLETYILAPRDPSDYQALISAYREAPTPDDIDVVIGVRGPIAPPDMCNGLSVPVVGFDKLYSFTRKTLVESIPIPPTVTDSDSDQFREAAGGVFDRILYLSDNAGAINEHRALNYMIVRYPRIYAAVNEANDRNVSLTGVEVQSSSLSTMRTIVEVIFSFTHRETDVVEKQFARVDVSEEYPFLVTKLGPYFER